MVYSKGGAEKGVWKVPMEGSNPVRLNDAEADFPTISPDGKLIAYPTKTLRQIPRTGSQSWHSKVDHG